VPELHASEPAVPSADPTFSQRAVDGKVADVVARAERACETITERFAGQPQFEGVRASGSRWNPLVTVIEPPSPKGFGVDQCATFTLEISDTEDGEDWQQRGTYEIDLWASPSGHHIAYVGGTLSPWGAHSAPEVIRGLRSLPFIDFVEHQPESSGTSARHDRPIPVDRLPKRTMGIENEYGIRMIVDGTAVSGNTASQILLDQLSQEDIRGSVDELMAGEFSRSTWHRNGSRIYPDVSQPEVATPECTDLLDLVAYDAAGDRILAERVEGILRQGDPGIELSVYKVSARNWVSGHRRDAVLDAIWGSHENFLVDRSLPLSRLEWNLVPLLAARPMLVGTGGYNPRGDDYRVSLRAESVESIVSDSAQGSRPFIMVRDEPLADSSRFRRLQIVSADATPGQHGTFLRMGMTHLVLRQIESGLVGFGSLALKNAPHELRRVGTDPTGRHLLKLIDGRRMTALDVLEAYLEKTERFKILADQGHTDPLRADEVLAIETWRLALDDLRLDLSDGGSRTSDRIDWVLKRDVLQRAAGRGRQAFALRQLDTEYHNVNNGLARQFENAGGLQHVVPNDRVVRAMTDPPATRAAIRSKLIAAAEDLDCTYSAHWDRVRFDIPPHLRISRTTDRLFVLDNPLATSSSAVNKFVAQLRAKDRETAQSQQPNDGEHAG
jgi:proteasome accessory factor A